MRTHRIHLKGPWEVDWLEAEAGSRSADAPAGSSVEDQPRARRRTGERRVRLPATWQSLFGDAPGTARFRRPFHRPTNLDAEEQVYLILAGVGGRADISLNGRQLAVVAGAAFSAEFAITPLLQPSNALVIELAFDPTHHPEQPGGLWAPVALEIRATESDRTIPSSPVPG